MKNFVEVKKSLLLLNIFVYIFTLLISFLVINYASSNRGEIIKIDAQNVEYFIIVPLVLYIIFAVIRVLILVMVFFKSNAGIYFDKNGIRIITLIDVFIPWNQFAKFSTFRGGFRLPSNSLNFRTTISRRVYSLPESWFASVLNSGRLEAQIRNLIQAFRG